MDLRSDGARRADRRVWGRHAVRGYTTVGLGLAATLLMACQGRSRTAPAGRLYAPHDVPPEVAETRLALLTAARSGDLNAFRPILAKADHFRFNYSVQPNPIAYWQGRHARRSERPVMRALAQVLALPPARSEGGDFGWPYLANLPAQPYAQLAPETAADINLRMTRESWNAQAADAGYTGDRLSLGADGTWTGFIAGD